LQDVKRAREKKELYNSYGQLQRQREMRNFTRNVVRKVRERTFCRRGRGVKEELKKDRSS